jgi:DNA-binding NarL/FixJ family response regulator
MAERIRILLADDHPVMRDGISHILNREPDLEVVGQVGDGDQLLSVCATIQPDVLVLDLVMPGPPALQVVSYFQSCCAATRIVIFSAYESHVDFQELLRLGISAFVSKDERPEVVIQAIRAAHAGSTLFSAPMVQRLREAPVKEPLSQREEEVLELVMRGWTNEHVAQELKLTERTVRFHLTNIYGKLGVSGRAEAVAWAARRGMGRPPEQDPPAPPH